MTSPGIQEALPWATAWPLWCHSGPDMQAVEGGKAAPGQGGTGPALGMLSHCSWPQPSPGKCPRSSRDPCASPQGVCLLLLAELATAHPARPGPAALPALPHHDPSPAVSPSKGQWVLRHAARAGCWPSPARLPNSRACHGAAPTPWARRATRRRIRRQVGAMAPCA